MSATIGTELFLTISFNAVLLASSGTETRTKSAPASAADVICLRVALTSVVSVFVIVCTDIGASPPIATFPTFICLERRLSMVRQGRTWLIDILILECYQSIGCNAKTKLRFEQGTY